MYRRADRSIIRCQRHRTKLGARCYKVSPSDTWKLELPITIANRQDGVDQAGLNLRECYIFHNLPMNSLRGIFNHE